MIQFLEFTFQDFTHFVGVIILIAIVGGVLVSIAAAFRRKP